jgi:hypothetical protein
MMLYCAGVSYRSDDGVLVGRLCEDTKTLAQGSHVKTKAEAGKMHLHIDGCQGSSETTQREEEASKDSSLEPSL